MTITFWDAGVIAGWMVAWFMLIALVIGIIGAIGRSRKQRNEIYKRLRSAVNTQDEFEQIVRTINSKDGGKS
jgi:hypothetical protein